MKVPRALRGLVRGAGEVVVLTHKNPDGDAVGALLGLTLALRDGGKEAVYVLPQGVPERYRFLFDGCRQLVRRRVKDGALVFVLDCAGLARVGGLPSKRRRGVLVNVDHHADNSFFGEVNVVDASASSTAEIVEKIIRACGLPLSGRAAESLLAGIYADTGSFNHANTCAETFRAAGRLAAGGGSPARVAENLYRRRSGAAQRLLTLMLRRQRFEYGGRLSWSYLRRRDFAATGAQVADSEDYIDYLGAVRGVKIYLLFREGEPGEMRVSLRSKGTWRVDDAAHDLGGGGHGNAAGCKVRGGLPGVRRAVFRALEDRLPILCGLRTGLKER